MENYTSDKATWISGEAGGRKWKVTDMTDTLLTTVIPMKRLKGFHDENFDSNQQIAKDSGGFALLKDPTLAEELDVESLIQRHVEFGVKDNDMRMTLDFPIPRCLPFDRNEVVKRQFMTALWWEEMEKSLPGTIPIFHGRNREEVIEHREMYNMDDRLFAFGSNLAQSTYTQMDEMGRERKKPKKTLVQREKLWEVITDVSKELREWNQPWFLLGAGGMKASQLAWIHGASFVDGTSWRMSAMHHQLMLPEIGRYAYIGYKRNNTEKENIKNYLMYLWNEVEDWPFHKDKSNLTLYEVLKAMTNGTGVATGLRAQHNIWALDRDAAFATSFAGDPEGYARHLLEINGHDGRFRKLVKKAIVSVKDASIQQNLLNYTVVA
tara:strand:- start:1441 stop:2577 length:1137 start_codon:yes stop_codon:yes gene_type:complete